jgi:orotate phosphoribosyltransferase
MNTDDVLAEFRAAGALGRGTSCCPPGLHSPVFLQKNLVFMDAARTERLCHALARKAQRIAGGVDVVVSPAVGGHHPRATRSGGNWACPRCTSSGKGAPFDSARVQLQPGARVLMVEDIVTTGLSSRECIAAIREAGRRGGRGGLPGGPLGRTGGRRRAR